MILDNRKSSTLWAWMSGEKSISPHVFARRESKTDRSNEKEIARLESVLWWCCQRHGEPPELAMTSMRSERFSSDNRLYRFSSGLQRIKLIPISDFQSFSERRRHEPVLSMCYQRKWEKIRRRSSLRAGSPWEWRFISKWLKFSSPSRWTRSDANFPRITHVALPQRYRIGNDQFGSVCSEKGTWKSIIITASDRAVCEV